MSGPFALDASIITGKSVTVWIVPGMGPQLTVTAGVPSLAATLAGGSTAYNLGNPTTLATAGAGVHVPLGTLSRLKFDNRTEHSIQQASNLGGGVARPPAGIRMLKGYLWAWGDTTPLWPNDLFGCNFTLDGVAGHSVTNPCLRCTAVEVIADAYDEQKKNKVFYVCHFAGAGFDFAPFTESGSDPQVDTSQPAEYSTKGLGIGLGPQGSISVVGGKTVMAWSGGSAGRVIPFVESMHFTARALADPDWNSSLQGIAFTARGDIDWELQVRQRINQWSTPYDPVIGDLDSVQSLLMATRLNSDLSFATGWGLEGAHLGAKVGEYDHGTKILTTDYTFEKTIIPNGSGGFLIGSVTDPTGTTRFGTIGS